MTLELVEQMTLENPHFIVHRNFVVFGIWSVVHNYFKPTTKVFFFFFFFFFFPGWCCHGVTTQVFYSENIRYKYHMQSWICIWYALIRGGYLVERWVRGCATQIGCFFGLSGFAMAPFLFENWFWYTSRFCKMHNFRWIFPLVYL